MTSDWQKTCVQNGYFGFDTSHFAYTASMRPPLPLRLEKLLSPFKAGGRNAGAGPWIVRTSITISLHSPIIDCSLLACLLDNENKQTSRSRANKRGDGHLDCFVDDPRALISPKLIGKSRQEQNRWLGREGLLCKQAVERRRHGVLTPAQHHVSSAKDPGNECVEQFMVQRSLSPGEGLETKDQ